MRKLLMVLAIIIAPSTGIILVHAQSAYSGCIIDVSKPGAQVAPICMGQQIAEFNYEFQGGLYAQLINNPSFEEAGSQGDTTSALKFWSAIKRGSSNGSIVSETSGMLNSKQYHCLKLNITSVASGYVGAANMGYWGIKLENNTTYKVSFWVRKDPDFSGTIKAQLESNDGKSYASQTFTPTEKWAHYTCDLTTSGISEVVGTNRFVIYGTSTGTVYIDVVTVMPPTWKNRPNGMRPDLAEKIDALKFRYINLPGGCNAESCSMDTCWGWKNSIGPIEERPGSSRVIWGYRDMLYFGLDDYFQMCEDLGAEMVYTTSSGISENQGHPLYGVSPIWKMQPIIDDILDLLEYCNGTTSTKWGAKRAANGHPAPYNLTYIEIGNENGWETAKEYGPRYAIIHDSILAHYPYVKFIYNGFRQEKVISHPFGNQVDFVDEHFYLKDLSVLYNKYDSIDPACKKICVAEYANSSHGNGGDVIGNFGDALGDASFMLGCEKNSERVWWTGYGNYSGFIGHSNFGPCIVWNDAVSYFCAPSYYGQKMLFTDNRGTRVLPFTQNTANCFWSASIDRESGRNDVLIKVVNKSATPESVDIILKGVAKVDPQGHSSILTGAPDDENSLADPTRVIPTKGTFMAGTNFKYPFPAWSITVLRIKVLK